MNEFDRETWRTVGKTSGAVVVVIGALFLLVPEDVPPREKTLRLEWKNGPGATITDVWGTTNLSDWYHVGRVTNAERWIIEKKYPAEFYRVSHPIEAGHWFDPHREIWRTD